MSLVSFLGAIFYLSQRVRLATNPFFLCVNRLYYSCKYARQANIWLRQAKKAVRTNQKLYQQPKKPASNENSVGKFITGDFFLITGDFFGTTKCFFLIAGDFFFIAVGFFFITVCFFRITVGFFFIAGGFFRIAGDFFRINVQPKSLIRTLYEAT
jgi:hypothetical protein